MHIKNQLVTVESTSFHPVLFLSPAPASLCLPCHTPASTQNNLPVKAAAAHPLQSAQHIFTSSTLTALPDIPALILGLFPWFRLSFLLTTSPRLCSGKPNSILFLTRSSVCSSPGCQEHEPCFWPMIMHWIYHPLSVHNLLSRTIIKGQM